MNVVLITEAVTAQLMDASEAAAPYETGGILLGLYAEGGPWITHTVELPQAVPELSRYRVPRGATRTAVLAAREIDQRVGYLGDWHSHPGDAPASSTDLRTYLGSWLFALRRSEAQPMLVVVRRAPEGWRIDVTARQEPRGRPQVIPSVLTGQPEATGGSRSGLV